LIATPAQPFLENFFSAKTLSSLGRSSHATTALFGSLSLLVYPLKTAESQNCRLTPVSCFCKPVRITDASNQGHAFAEYVIIGPLSFARNMPSLPREKSAS